MMVMMILKMTIIMIIMIIHHVDDDDNDYSDDDGDDDDDDNDDGCFTMVSLLHDWGQAGRSFISPGKLGAEKEAEEVGDATNLLLHQREGCLANSWRQLLKAFEGKQTIQRKNGRPKQKSKRGRNRQQTNE